MTLLLRMGSSRPSGETHRTQSLSGSLQEAFDIFKPPGFAKLEEPNGLQRQMDTMDSRHLLLLATGTRTIRMPDREAEELVEFSGPAFGLPPSRCQTHPEGLRRTKIQDWRYFPRT